MRKITKVLIVLTMLIVVFACGNKSEAVSLEKDGKLYEVADMVSFYYPKEFTLDVTSRNNQNVVQFVKDEEVIFYSMIVDDTDNSVEDMPALYAGELEMNGVNDVAYKNIEIESGLTCQEFTGTYQATGIKFKHMVYFTTEASYVLGYQSVQGTYDENVKMISQYLSTLTVNLSNSLDKAM